jgi:glycosyltransferase involved in cell wall biosynthesis
MPKIVVYTDSAGIGGAEISLGHLVTTASKDFEIVVVGVSSTVVNFIANQRLSADRIVIRENFLSHYLIFKQLKPDLIHINLCTPWACALALSAALMANIHVIRVDQLPLRTTDAIALWRTRFLSLRVDAHVAVGAASCRRMEDFYALGRDSVLSIPNCVPDLGEAPLQPNQPMIVGSIGRLDAMKAHDVLLKAVAQVEEVQVRLLGDGGERENLEQMAIALGIRDRVQFVGWVDNPRSYLPQFDVVALPSRSEGFPLAMVEAMLASRPVIATQVGSMPEAIGDAGFLIEKNDVKGLAIALTTLRDHPDLRVQLGKQARQKAVANFTVEAMTKVDPKGQTKFEEE